jgi:hypothetical protein
VGVFTHRRDAEHALHELRDSGFAMDRVSVVVRDAHRNDNDIAGAQVGENIGNKADEGATVGLLSGGALGGLTGLLVGLGTLAIPGIGPIMLAGATATALATTLAGVGIGAVAGGLLGGLVGLGIPEERARVYNERVERGHYLVIVDGTDAEIARAEAILHRRGIEEYGVYDHPNGKQTTVATTQTSTAAPVTYIDKTTATTQTSTAVPVTYIEETTSANLHLHRSRRAIGVFSHRRDAEAALKELQDAGFSLNKVSLIAKDERGSDRIAGAVQDHEHGNKADEGARTGAITGGALGGLGGLLVGLGTLAIPGIGPIMLAGATATALATTLAGAGIGAAAGGVAGGLVGLGIPEEQAKVYSDRFNRGHYLVMIEGTDAELGHAEAILRRRGIEDFSIYDAADRDRTPGYDHSAELHSEDPAVIIIDRRDEKV